MIDLNNISFIVCDDDESIRALLRKVIENCGGKVSEAVNRQDILTLVADQTPHFIILDIHLGKDDNGLKIMHEMKQDPTLKNIPILILSRLTNGPIIDAAIQMGATDYLLKPFKSYEVLASIQKNLSKSKSHVLDFFPDQKVTVDCKFPIKLKKVNEFSLVFESTGCFSAETEIGLESNFMNSIDAQFCQYKIKKQSTFLEEDLYQTEVKIIGFNEEVAKKIRRLKY